jgi:serine/threonine protein kinase/tetratricopeptide (TPR) repeat protein
MSPGAADLNLLLGIMAIQNDFVSRDALIEAMAAWVLDKSESLGDILVERGALSPDRHALLSALVAEHIKAHHNDTHESLASVPSVSTVRQQLSQIANADLQASLAVVGSAQSIDPEATMSEGRSLPGARYRILRPHAKGGLGEVFVAEDVELHREVALKEIQDAHANDVFSRGRFLLEAEVTGRLEHPGIVPVYGLGQYADGRPFYAMRFIHGENLNVAIRRFHNAEQTGRDQGERRLALRQLLGRFVDVCNAVAYAHSRGVLHRDLKPGNIMLGKYGETLVVDWGLAKAGVRDQGSAVHERIDETTLRPSSGSGVAATQMGSAIGTPAYMSPEQAAGQLDKLGPTSDIYSLGATLYTLLTGQVPLREAGPGEILQKVRSGEIIPPRGINAAIPAPLEAICLKAIALDPGHRYPTCMKLAEDIEHWLADEPVSAWPEPWTVRTGRWTRHHKASVSATAAALLAVALLGGGGWIWYRHEKDLRAVRAASQINHALTAANQLWAEARATGSPKAWMEAKAAAQRAEEIAAVIDVEEGLRQRVEELQEELMHEASEVERDQQMLARLEEIRIRRAEVRGEGFSFVTAVPAYAEAFRDYGLDVEKLEPEVAGAEIQKRPIQRALVAALDEWAWIRSKAESRSSGWQRLVAAARAADPDPWRNSLRHALSQQDIQALKNLATSANVAELPAPTLELLGHALGLAGAASEAVALLRRTQRQYPSDFWINQHLAYFLASHKPPQWDEAIRFYSVALALRSDSPGVYVNYGVALQYKGLLDEAILAFEKAVALKTDYAGAYVNLGLALHKKGKAERAGEMLKKAARLRPNDANMHFHMGMEFARQDAGDEAVAALHEALRLMPDHVAARIGLGIVQARRGELADAIITFKEARRLQPASAESHAYVGGALSNHGDLDEALVSLEEAIRLNPNLALAHKYLGVTLEKKKQFDAAAAAYQKAIRLQPQDPEAHRFLGLVWKTMGRWDDAITSFQEAIRLEPSRAESHFELAIVLSDRKHDDEGAVAEFNRAISLKADYAEAYCNLGHVLRKQGHFVEALEATRRGHEIGSMRADWRYPSGQWVREAERMMELDEKLTAVLWDVAAPASAEEMIELARICAVKRHFAAAARFSEEAFRAKPALAEDLRVNNRYNAACMAVLAAASRGADTATLDETKRVRWRRQALEWLRADMARMSEILESQPSQGRVVIQVALPNWQDDASLASVRAKAALAKLPEAERTAWQQLWVEVAELLERAKGLK